MKKIKKFFRANKIPIIIFTILIIFELTQIYQNAIKEKCYGIIMDIKHIKQ